MVLATLLLLLAISDISEARRGKKNCGLKCFSWKKCMGQIDGNNRPGQLGDTGQIVLNKCDSGGCDCVALEEEEKRKKAEAAAPKTTTRSPPQENRFKRQRGNSLASLISRRKPIPKRNRSPEQSPATLQSLQSSNRFSRPRVVSTSQRATYSVSTSSSVSSGNEKPTKKRDSIKDQIATRKSKPASRFASYSNKSRSASSNEDVNELARRRRLRYFSRRRL